MILALSIFSGVCVFQLGLLVILAVRLRQYYLLNEQWHAAYQARALSEVRR